MQYCLCIHRATKSCAAVALHLSYRSLYILAKLLVHFPQERKTVLCRFEFPQQLDMYKYTVEGLAEAEQAGAEAPGPEAPSPSPSPSPSPPQSPLKAKQEYQYKLKGIVVHSGTAFAGHYYSFIKVTCPVFATKRMSRAFTPLATPNISPENSSCFLLISAFYASMPGPLQLCMLAYAFHSGCPFVMSAPGPAFHLMWQACDKAQSRCELLTS